MGSLESEGNQQASPEVLPVVTPVASVAQYSLIPRRAIIETAAPKKTANCTIVAEADDGLIYYLKEDKNTKYIRASEWISTELAEAVGIAAPSAMPIQRIDGTVVFGSRRLGGVSDQATTIAYLTRSTIETSETSNLSMLLSRIYAFDLMIFNEDRNLGNYLTVEDSGKLFLYAFDYSQSLFCAWPLSGFPGLGTRTRTVGKLLRSRHGFDLEAADELLTRLTFVSAEQMQSFMDRMPDDWLPHALRQSIIRFWGSADRMIRINTIRQGVSNGWLL